MTYHVSFDSSHFATCASFSYLVTSLWICEASASFKLSLSRGEIRQGFSNATESGIEIFCIQVAFTKCSRSCATWKSPEENCLTVSIVHLLSLHIQNVYSLYILEKLWLPGSSWIDFDMFQPARWWSLPWMECGRTAGQHRKVGTRLNASPAGWTFLDSFESSSWWQLILKTTHQPDVCNLCPTPNKPYSK